jgi:hypothetical protein
MAAIMHLLHRQQECDAKVAQVKQEAAEAKVKK